MLRLTLVIGGILTALGVVAYVGTGTTSVTALIPTLIGILLLGCGLVAARRPNARRHAMHAALLVALLGALGSLTQVAKLGQLLAGTAERPTAIVVSTIMFVLLAVLLVAGVRSFVAARRARSQA
jgi:peptidoglycan/LPS O-acetylase OafA/YrhL